MMLAKKRLVFLFAGGLLCLFLAAAAFVGVQVCFTQNFWLHAMVFPLNPQTVSQPTALTYLGTACEIACPVFLLMGIALLAVGGYHAARYGMGNRTTDPPPISRG